MKKFKNSWLEVDFPRKVHNDLKLIAKVTDLGFCGAAVEAMRIGIKVIMARPAQAKPTTSKEAS